MTASHAGDAAAARFVEWFKQHGEQSDAIGLTHFPGMGRGAVALRDIAPDEVLFSIPRSLLLNTTNSRLASLLTEAERASLRNWTPLILTMMWEARQPDSRWRPYFDIMPTEFDSLMFWSEEELRELKGSTIVEKIGKAQALADYHELVRPLVAARPDVFGDDPEFSYYSEALYNTMGSLILSRSFHVEEGAEEADQDSEGEGEGEEKAAGDGSAMNISGASQAGAEGSSLEGAAVADANAGSDEEAQSNGEGEDEDGDDEESVSHIAMVPWADMLNARHGCDNARLFYEPERLAMQSTRAIRQGEQIWNVYGDPPNSDLLRRYGHTDEENPADLVEITADLVAGTVETTAALQRSLAMHEKRHEGKQSEGAQTVTRTREERIEFLLEADLDDTYAFTLDDHEEELEQLLCCIAVFHAGDAAFAKMKKRGRVSKKAIKDDMDSLLGIAREVFIARQLQYPHSFEDDAAYLQHSASSTNVSSLSTRKRHAVIVRHGEMRILRSIIAALDAKLPPRPSYSFLAQPNPAAPMGLGAACARKAADADVDMGDMSVATPAAAPADALPEKPRILSKKEQREEKKRQREEDQLLSVSAADRKKRRA